MTLPGNNHHFHIHFENLYPIFYTIKQLFGCRRLVLRYDKLYMGNDVFFYNDKSGRVERINNGKAEPSSSSYSSLMESMITSDAQQSAHDSAWLRRPRSKYSR